MPYYKIQHSLFTAAKKYIMQYSERFILTSRHQAAEIAAPMSTDPLVVCFLKYVWLTISITVVCSDCFCSIFTSLYLHTLICYALSISHAANSCPVEPFAASCLIKYQIITQIRETFWTILLHSASSQSAFFFPLPLKGQAHLVKVEIKKSLIAVVRVITYGLPSAK